MGRLFLLTIIVFFVYNSWPSLVAQKQKLVETGELENIKNELLELKNDPELVSFVTSVGNAIDELLISLKQSSDTPNEPTEESEKESSIIHSPDLTTPENDFFAVHNIEIGDKRTEVEQQVGKSKRSSLNEYGTEWHAYHTDYQNFLMISYDQSGKVNGLFTTHDLISSENGEVSYGVQKEIILQHLGQPLAKIQKGLTFFQFEGNRGYDLYKIDNSFVTIFYDVHQENTLTGIQIISSTLENNKKSIYAEPSEELIAGFEYQLFDLTNAERVHRGLPTLKWDEHVRITARDHSEDMAEKNYFSHTNLEGQSPFDRMLEDKLTFITAGENLAHGQFSSIFAHEGLMNSIGHRENILKSEYEHLGVGVAFNQNEQPYYTEKFYAK